jgi:hypothetical protein
MSAFGFVSLKLERPTWVEADIPHRAVVGKDWWEASLPGYYEASVASKLISTFIKLEIGQPAFACVAIDWNVAQSMSRILATTLRCTEVMENPSPSLSMFTQELQPVVRVCFRYRAGGAPNSRLKARLNAASDS